MTEVTWDSHTHLLVTYTWKHPRHFTLIYPELKIGIVILPRSTLAVFSDPFLSFDSILSPADSMSYMVFQRLLF